MLFVLGMHARLSDVVDSVHDLIGRRLEDEKLPQRIRMPNRKNKGNNDNVNKVRNYKATIEKEMTDICSDILDLLTEYLIPNA